MRPGWLAEAGRSLGLPFASICRGYGPPRASWPCLPEPACLISQARAGSSHPHPHGLSCPPTRKATKHLAVTQALTLAPAPALALALAPAPALALALALAQALALALALP